MIARIATRGHSFKGAGMYYLHDKEAQTTKRVIWSETRNLPTENREAAIKLMAYTAINSNKIKQEANVPLTGRKRKKSVVYTFSLSWSPEEEPDQKIMVKSADETLEVLGLQDHQSLIVAHNDTDHPHIHVICNLINPNDGRMHDPDWGSKLKMSDWSQKYELESGKIYCEQRVENNEKRKQGKLVKYKEPLHNRKAEIQGLYRQSNNGKEFSAKLEEKGYTLAKGNRRRFVLVDDYGRIHSLSRQLDKEQRTDHLEKLSDLSSKNLLLAKDVAANRQYFDRDKQEREQLQRIEDAAIEKAKKEDKLEKQSRALAMKKNKAQPLGREMKNKESKVEKGQYIANDNKKHLIQLDKEQAWDREAQRKRLALGQQLSKQYNRQKTVDNIKVLLQEIISSKGNKAKGLREELKVLRLNLENMDTRINEQRDALEAELEKTNPYTSKEESKLMEGEPLSEIDLEAELNRRKVEELNAKLGENIQRIKEEKQNPPRDKEKHYGNDL